jgi:hypothetical protein
VTHRALILAVLIFLSATAPVSSQDVSVTTTGALPDIGFRIVFGGPAGDTIIPGLDTIISPGDPPGLALLAASIELPLAISGMTNSHSYQIGKRRISEAEFLRLAGLDPLVSTRYREESRRHLRRGLLLGGSALVGYVGHLFRGYEFAPPVLATAAASWATYEFVQSARRGSTFLYSYEALTIAEYINSGHPEDVADYWPEFPERRPYLLRDLGYDLRPPR